MALLTGTTCLNLSLTLSLPPPPPLPPPRFSCQPDISACLTRENEHRRKSKWLIGLYTALLFTVSVHPLPPPPLLPLIWYRLTRVNGQQYQHVQPPQYYTFLVVVAWKTNKHTKNNIEGTKSSKICVRCLCIHVLFYVCVGINFVDLTFTLYIIW